MSTPFEPLLRIVQCGRAFTAVGGRAFIFLPAQPPGYFTVAVRSRAFRQWFYDRCYSESSTIPSPQAFAAILHHLEAQAARDPETCNIRVPFRVDSRGLGPQQILLDLANPAGEYVEITARGWRTTSGMGVPFETSPATGSLPAPEPPGEPCPDPNPLDTLRATLNLGPPGSPGWLSCLAWLLSALRPAGPYPILILRGPSGSGKSFAGRTLRTLIDPSASPFTPLPSSARELLTFARHNWILAFDHIATLTPHIAAALCRLSSGSGVVCREPGQPDPLQLWIKRPILLTADEGWIPPPALAARALIVSLPALIPAARRAEHQLAGVIDRAFPQILGALCSGVSHALAGPPPPIGSPTRHADALAWAQSAALAVHCTPGQFRDAFESQPSVDPFIHAVRAALHSTPHWSGTATELHGLMPVAPNPQSLSRRLNNSSLALADAGIDVQIGRLSGGRRRIDLIASQDFQQSLQPVEKQGVTDTDQVPPALRNCVTNLPSLDRIDRH